MKGKKVRIVFMGTPEFAVESLIALVSGGYQVVGVVTSPDRPAGRGQKLKESAVGEYASANGIKVLKPEKMKDQGFLEELGNLNADLQVVVAFRMLPEVVWNMPPLGTFNLHASLLPQYRGAAPINWAIINGEKETGVTTFLLDHQIDTGKIIFSEKTTIGDDETAGDLHNRLMVTGARLVLRTVDAIAKGIIIPLDQNTIQIPAWELRHAPKIFRENCMVDWRWNAESIRNLIRGLSPSPAAWTKLVHDHNQTEIVLKIYFATKQTEIHSYKPGTIISDNKSYLKIACSDGWIFPTKLQIEGRRIMKTEEFLRGFSFSGEFHAI